MNEAIEEFLRHSNYIEKERSEEAYEAAKEAWEYADAARDKLVHRTLTYIQLIHKKLMMGLNPRIAGEWRRCDIIVGGHRCPFISATSAREDILKWWEEDFLMEDATELQIKQAHVRFEKIHPFEDGNGRTGRILYNIQRLNNIFPIHVIHEGAEQQEYYKWFTQGVR